MGSAGEGNGDGKEQNMAAWLVSVNTLKIQPYNLPPLGICPLFNFFVLIHYSPHPHPHFVLRMIAACAYVYHLLRYGFDLDTFYFHMSSLCFQSIQLVFTFLTQPWTTFCTSPHMSLHFSIGSTMAARFWQFLVFYIFSCPGSLFMFNKAVNLFGT